MVYDYVKWLYQFDITPIKFECFRYKKAPFHHIYFENLSAQDPHTIKAEPSM